MLRALIPLRSFAIKQGKPAAAQTAYDEILAIARRSPPNAEIALGLVVLTEQLLDETNFTQAELRAQDSLTIYEKIKPNDPDAFQARRLLGAALFRQKKYTDAEREYRRLANDLRKTADSGDVAVSLGNLAGVLAAQGKQAEAESTLREGLNLVRETSKNGQAPETPALGILLHHLAEVLWAQKNLGEARPLAEEAVALYQRHSDWNWSEAEHALYVLRTVLTDQRDFEQLDVSLPQHVEFLRARLPANEFAGTLAMFVLELLGREKFVEAEPLARECLTIREKTAPDDWRMFNSRSALGGSLLGQKKYAEAEPLLLSGYEGMMQREDKIPPIGRPRLKETLQRLVKLCEATSRPNQVAKWKQKLAEFEEKEEHRSAAITRETQNRDSDSKTNSPPK